jgi:ATP-dependent helicase/nuclease subunit A
VDRRLRLKFPSLAHDALARQLHKETLAEEMRVLYVALTRRARTAGTDRGRGRRGPKRGPLAAGARRAGPRLDGEDLLRDKKPLDWLAKALLRHPDAGACAPARELRPAARKNGAAAARDRRRTGQNGPG